MEGPAQLPWPRPGRQDLRVGRPHSQKDGGGGGWTPRNISCRGLSCAPSLAFRYTGISTCLSSCWVRGLPSGCSRGESTVCGSRWLRCRRHLQSSRPPTTSRTRKALGTSTGRTISLAWGVEGGSTPPMSVKGTGLKWAWGAATPSLGPPSSPAVLLRSRVLLLPCGPPRGRTLSQAWLPGSLAWAERVEGRLRPLGRRNRGLAEPGAWASLGGTDGRSVFSGV